MEKRSLKNKLFILFIIIFFLVSVVLYFVPSTRGDENRAESLAEAKVFYQVTEPDTAGLSVDFINVGQGDCTLISCNGRNMLIDSGEADYNQIVKNFLDKKNITHFDYVLLSHPHSDHGGGMEKIAENYSIGVFLLPQTDVKNEDVDDFYPDLLTLLEKRQVLRKYVKAGDVYKLSDAEIKILGPLKNGEEINDTSVVCTLEYGGKKFLFTGDAPESEEIELVESGAELDCDVLKVSHHGSRDATSDAFLKEASPSFAVISVSEYNEYNHPHGKTLKKLLKNDITLYRTDRDGTISFRIPDENSEIILG